MSETRDREYIVLEGDDDAQEIEQATAKLEAEAEAAEEAVAEAAEEAVDEAAEDVATEVEADAAEFETEEIVVEAVEIADEPEVVEEAAEDYPAEELSEETARLNELEDTAKAYVAEDVQPEELDLVPEPIAEEEVLVEQPVDVEVAEEAGFMARMVKMPIVLAAGAIALVAGLAIGSLVLGGSKVSGEVQGKTTVAETELESAVGSFTYNGKTTPISAREVIEMTNGSVDSAKKEDGSFGVPSADSILAFARTSILLQEAEAKGITASDEEINAYVTQLGAQDLATIATAYGMEEDSLKELLRQSIVQNKLRESVVTADTTKTMPEAPTAPEEGKEEEPTADYATYIINLAGEEWDAKKGAWAAADGPYATALASHEITAESATYAAAQAAYAVAYQQYSEVQTQATTEWTDYVNGLLENASIEIGTLITQ